MPKVTMPQLGESVAEGTIGRWLKQVGDHVDKYEPIVEVVTDKVNAEVPSPFEGTLAAILVQEGETVANNTEIAVIDGAGDAPDASATASDASAGSPDAPGAHPLPGRLPVRPPPPPLPRPDPGCLRRFARRASRRNLHGDRRRRHTCGHRPIAVRDRRQRRREPRPRGLRRAIRDCCRLRGARDARRAPSGPRARDRPCSGARHRARWTGHPRRHPGLHRAPTDRRARSRPPLPRARPRRRRPLPGRLMPARLAPRPPPRPRCRRRPRRLPPTPSSR